MARQLQLYENRDRIETLSGIIGKYAPPNENDTDSYIRDVSALCEVTPDSPLDVKPVLPKLIAAIITHENGSQPYSSDVIALGISLAEA